MENYAITAGLFAAAFVAAAAIVITYRDDILRDQARIPAPVIPFADLWDASLSDPDNPSKKFRVDFARLEQGKPLTRAHRMMLTPREHQVLVSGGGSTRSMAG
jgi:hypothetical protein